MKRILFIFLTMFITFIISVSGFQEYDTIGGDFGDYNIPISNKFDSSMTDDLPFFYPLSNVHGTPLVKDLDGDGSQEIVVLANNAFWIFHFGNNALTLMGGESMDSQETGTDLYSNFLIYDLDSDGKHEIIVHQQATNKIYSFEWNGTELIEDKNWTGIGAGCPFGNCAFATDSMIGCGHSEGCVIVYGNGNYVRSSGTYENYVLQFDYNMDNITEHRNTILSYSWGSNRPHCFPRLGVIHYSAKNAKYYFVSHRPFVTAYLWEIDINSSQFPIDDFVTNGHTMDSLSSCGRGVNTISSPVSGLFEQVPTDYEIGYGYQKNDNQFKLIVYNDDLSENGVFPAIEDGEGELRSNTFMASAFPRSQIRGRDDILDMCVVGYDVSDRDVTVLCATKSYNLDGALSNVEFVYHLDDTYFNISGQQIYTTLAHSVESNLNNKQDEVLTAYGVFKLDDYSQISPVTNPNCRLAGNCEMDLIYEYPVNEESAVIMADVESNHNPDIISLQATSLTYVDDGFVNRPPYFGYCTEVRPAIDDTWLEHGNSKITLRPFDSDGDNVRGRVIWFEGLSITPPPILEQNVSVDVFDFPDEFWWVIGENEEKTVTATYFLDGFDHKIREEDIGEQRLEVYYNFTDMCSANERLDISIYAKWNADIGDDLNIYIHNFTDGDWIELPIDIIAINSENWYNTSIDLNNMSLIEKGYVQNDVLTFKFNDTSMVDGGAGSDDKLETDLFQIRCVGFFDELENDSQTYVVDSGWSPWFVEGTPIPLTNSDLEPIGNDFSLKLMIQDDMNNDTIIEEFTFDIDTAENGGLDFLSSASCLGMTVEEYDDFIESGGLTCVTSSDCDEDRYCDAGVCRILPTCEVSSECPSDYACIQESCEQIPSGEDSEVTNAVKGFAFFAGVPIIVLFLIGLGVLSWMIFREESVGNSVKIPMIIIMSLFTIGAGTVLGLINVIWLILFIFVIVAIVGVFVAGFLKSKPEG